MEHQRTNQQNKSYHKWIKELSDECNDKGITLKVLFKDPGEVPVTPQTIHEGMLLALAKARYGKDSSTFLTKAEWSELMIDLYNIIYERTGGEVDIAYPSQERLSMEDPTFIKN